MPTKMVLKMLIEAPSTEEAFKAKERISRAVERVNQQKYLDKHGIYCWKPFTDEIQES